MARAVVVALVGLGVAAGLAWLARSARAARGALAPGSSPGVAIEVASWSEVDAHLDRATCGCGGRPRSTGEGSREHGGRSLRVARLRCPKCGAASERWFAVVDEAADCPPGGRD